MRGAGIGGVAVEAVLTAAGQPGVKNAVFSYQTSCPATSPSVVINTAYSPLSAFQSIDKSRADNGSFFSTIWWGLNSNCFGGGNGTGGAIGWHEGPEKQQEGVVYKERGGENQMLQSMHLIKAESLEKRCRESASFTNGPLNNRLLPNPHQTNRKEAGRNYSSIIKLLETSPSRGLPLTGPTVEPLNSKLLYFIKLDCLLPLPAASVGEKQHVCVCVFVNPLPLSSVDTTTVTQFVCHYIGDTFKCFWISFK